MYGLCKAITPVQYKVGQQGSHNLFEGFKHGRNSSGLYIAVQVSMPSDPPNTSGRNARWFIWTLTSPAFARLTW